MKKVMNQLYPSNIMSWFEYDLFSYVELVLGPTDVHPKNPNLEVFRYYVMLDRFSANNFDTISSASIHVLSLNYISRTLYM